MSWKSVTYLAVSVVFVGSAAMAQPSLEIVDGGLNGSGNRVFDVIASPAVDDRSLAMEVGFSVSGANILSATSGSSWEDDGVDPVGNPGNNPFSGSVSDGVSVQANQTDVFAALGSAKLVSTGTYGNGDPMYPVALSIEIDGQIGVVTASGDYGGLGRIAEAGVNHDTYGGSGGIHGDYNKDNQVDIIDFGLFGADYGNVAAASDFNKSGGPIDIIDFGIFGSNYGLTGAGGGSGSAVPEPTSVALIGIALAGLAIRRLRS